MSHPPAGLEFLSDTPSIVTPPPQKKGVPTGLDFLTTPPSQVTKEHEQGFIDYVSNVAKNWISGGGIKAAGNMAMVLDPVSVGRMANDPSVQQAGSDFIHIFDNIFAGMGAGDPISVATHIPFALGIGQLSSPKEPTSIPAKIGQVAISLFKPVSDLMELSSGMQLTEDDTRALTPEEKTTRIKSSVGLIAATAVAGPLAGELGGELIGGVGKRLLANATVGGVAGGVYGAVAGANDRDQVAQIISNGIIGAGFGVLGTGLGTAKELLFGKSTRPQDIQQVRAIQDLDNSISENINTAKALASSDDLASALLQGKIGLKEGDIHVIPGVDPIKLSELNAKLPEGYRSAMHVDEDGVGRLLVYDTKSAQVLTGVPSNINVFRGAPADTPFTRSPGTGLAPFASNDPEYASKYGGMRNRTLYNITGRAENPIVFDSPTAASNFYKTTLSKDELTGLFDNDIVNAAKKAGHDLVVVKKYGPEGDINILVNTQKLSAKSVSLEEARNLAARNLDKVDERFFEKTGLLKNQEVSYLGKENWTVLDATGSTIKLKNTIDGNIVEAHKNDIQHPASVAITQKRDALVNSLYDEWKQKLETPPSEDVANANAEKYDLIGFDETPPTDFLDKHPEVEGIPVLKNLDDFLINKKFNPDEIKSLKRELQLKLANEAYQRLSPEDKSLVSEARNQYQKDLRSPRQKVRDYNSLSRIARSNGFRISDGGSGRVIIRSGDDNRILAGVDNYDAARDWINKSGKASGPKLDDNATIDTDIAGGGPPIPPSDGDIKYPQDDPYNYFYNDKHLSGSNWGEDVIRYLNNSAIITRYRDYMLDLDRKYGTTFARDIFENVNTRRNIRNAQARPHIEELDRIQGAAKLKPGDAEKVAHYIQTLTPEEVISSFMSRPMNPVEIGMAQKIAKAGVDLERIFNYRRNLEKLDRQFPADERAASADKQLAYQQQLETSKEAFAVDDNHLKVVDLLDSIESYPKNQISEGAVVRLARAINNGVGESELSRSQFAAKERLSMQQLMAANRVQELYKKLAGVFGISEDRQLGGYLTHAKLYFDGDIPKAMRHFSGDLKTKDFYAKMTRTGEVSAYETNAFKGTMRYIKAGFDVHSGFADALTSAKNAIETGIKKLDPDLQEQARNVMNRYLNDVQGFPEAGDRAAKEAVDYMMNKYRLGEDVNTRRTWASATQSVINAGALGLRPMLGIGHFGISNVISIAARDLGYTRRMLTNGAKVLADKEAMQALQDKGVFQGLSPFSSMRADIDPTSFASKIGGVIDHGQDIMFKATLLPTVYDGMAAGHYITTYNDALKGLTAFQRGEITGKQLTKDLYLRRFDAPVAQRFVEISKTNAEDAAHYLGMQAVEDLVGTYGSGNTPYKWGTNLGRVVGQFGNYAMWIRATVQRMASRGTMSDRIGSLAKLSALAYGAHEISKETGIDLTRMSPVHAMTWLFGPLVHIAEDAADALHTSGYQQRQAIGRLKRVLPINTTTGELQPSIFIPGSFAIDGIVQAADAFSKGNAEQGALLGLGFRKYQGGNKKPGL